jgi:hypothetical protein
VTPDAAGNWTPTFPGTPAWFPRPIYQDWVLILILLADCGTGYPTNSLNQAGLNERAPVPPEKAISCQ